MKTAIPRKTLLFHVNNFLTGGIEKVLLELLQALVARNRYRIILVIAYDLGVAETLLPQLPAEVEVRRVMQKLWMNRVRRKKTTGYLHPAEKAFWETFLPAVIRRQHLQKYRKWTLEADVIIDFDATLAPYIQELKGVRTAAYLHFAMATMWRGSGHKLDRLVRRLEQYDVVVTLCDEMRQDAAARYPVLESKLFRLYNALNFEKLELLKNMPVEAPLKPLVRQPYFLALGRLQETQKDFTTVIKAYAAAQREAPFPQSLLIVGDGADRKRLEALALAEGLQEKIVFTGFQGNPYPFIAGATAVLFGSKYEGLPTVLIEAQALGTPIIATECPTGVREILQSGRSGILVPVGDVASMAAGILRLLREPELAVSFRRAAAELLPKFNIQYAVEEFERGVLGVENTKLF
jgi:glycosyltransferase involved in cell wall biosynthesis